MFTQLITVGTAIALIVCAFFVMLAGYQYMIGGGSVRAIESAKGSLYNAFIGVAIVVREGQRSHRPCPHVDSPRDSPRLC
jgi:hypothetical protein